MEKQRNKQYFQLVTVGNVADLHIYGDITSWPWLESDVSAYDLSKQLAELENVTQINVYINSYGGEVMEGLAIYNALKRHKANVTTYCDGSACSIASVIFMAGDERIMCKPSFLMIHDAWTYVAGNADALRKQADDLDVITTASVTAYMEHINITEEKLRALMKDETWLTHTEALEMGFATAIEESSDSDKPAQSARNRWFEKLLTAIKMEADDEEKPDDEDDDAETPEKPAEAVDAPGEDDSDDEDKDDENGDSDNENADSDDDESSEDDKDENDKDPDKPAQLWSGFFNALFRE